MVGRIYVVLGWAGVLGIIAWAGMILLAAGAPQALMAHLMETSTHEGFIVREVEVVGRVHTDALELRTALGIEAGTPLLALDLAKAQARVEVLPWVESVRVERQWPDRIRVALTEHSPMARWAQRGDRLAVLIDAKGAVLARGNLAPFAKLPLIIGAGAPQAMPDLKALLDTQPAIAGRLAWAEYRGERRWDLILRTGARLKLPQNDPALALARLMDKAPFLLDRPVNVDLRLEDRIIVALQSGV